MTAPRPAVEALLARCAAVEAAAEQDSSHAYLDTAEIRAYLQPDTAEGFAAVLRARAAGCEDLGLPDLAERLRESSAAAEAAHRG